MCHENAYLYPSSLHLDKFYAFLVAFPDGLISCKCSGEGLIEIKCPYMYQNKTPHKAHLNHQYHVCLDENNYVKLKESSSW